jgi:hypothetical protein
LEGYFAIVRENVLGDSFEYKCEGGMILVSYCLIDNIVAKAPNTARYFVLEFRKRFNINEKNNSCDSIKNLMKVEQASADFISPKQIL